MMTGAFLWVWLAAGGTPNDALFAAVKKQDVATVRLALKKGGDVNGRDELGRTPLFYAVARNSLDLVKLLVAAKADVNAKETDHKGVVYFNVDVSGAKVLQFLVDHGLDRGELKTFLNTPDENNMLPIHNACRDGHLEFAKLLVQYGSPVNGVSKQGHSPLTLALANLAAKDPERENIVKFLLAQKADLSPRTFENLGAIEYAARANRIDLVRLMLKDKVPAASAIHSYLHGSPEIFRLVLAAIDDVNGVDRDQVPLLFFAVEKKDKALVAELIAKGARIDLRDRFRRPVTEVAATVGDAEIMGLLLKAGVSADLPGGRGEIDSPLNIAVRQGNRSLAELLFNAGAQANTPGRCSALETAIVKGDLEWVRYVVEKGADINGSAESGLSPLHIAIAYRGVKFNSEIVQYLLKNGADPRRAVEGFGSPRAWAERNNNAQAVQLLEQFGATAGGAPEAAPAAPAPAFNRDAAFSVMIAAIEANDAEALVEVVNKAGDVNFEFANGRTALFYAARSGKLDMVKTLLDRHANPAMASDPGGSLLHTACESGSLPLVQYLVREQKLDARCLDGSGATPGFKAVGFPSVISFLAESGMDLTAADSGGNMLLHLAVGRNDAGGLDTLKYLISRSVPLEVANSRGETAVARAKRMGNTDAVSLLLAAGAKDVGSVAPPRRLH